MEKEADYLSGAFGLFLQSVTNESDGIHQRRIFRTLFGKGSEGWSESGTARIGTGIVFCGSIRSLPVLYALVRRRYSV